MMSHNGQAHFKYLVAFATRYLRCAHGGVPDHFGTLPHFSYAETWEILNLFVGQKFLATVFVMKTNQILRPFPTSTEQ